MKKKAPISEPQKVFYGRLSMEKKRGRPSGEDVSREELDRIEFENQMHRLREKWGDLPIYTEVISGAKKRKVLHELIDTLPRGSTIYAVHLDRLSRAGVFDLGAIITKARLRGITIETLYDGVVTSTEKSNDIILALKAHVAQEEREATSRRVRDHIEARKEAGLKWGFEIARERGTWVHGGGKVKDPLWWNLAVPRLLQLRSEGLTFRQIAEVASREFGRPIGHAQVQRIVAAADRSKTPAEGLAGKDVTQKG